MILTHFDCKIKILKSDNGSEFHMNDFFQSNGIIHQLSCVETPQQNRIVERKHQHLLNIARAIKFQANLPHKFWDKLFLLLYIWSTESLPWFRKIKHPMRCYIKHHQHIHTSRCLNVFVVLQASKETVPSLILEPFHAFLLATLMAWKHSNYLIW